MSELLALIAFVLLMTLGVCLFAIGFVASIFKLTLNTYCKNIALSFDEVGNVIGADTWNFLLLKGNYYPFGLPKEKISGVLGKNKALNTLNRFGRWMATDLDALDPNHVENSIDKNVI